MKTIPLTQGQFAIVDDEDYAELSQFKWCVKWNRGTNTFYAIRNVRMPSGKWKTESMHRRLLGLGPGDEREGDHVNHATLDNRRSNIRIVTMQENQHNQIRKGYYWNKDRKKFQAQIKVNGVKKGLGCYDDPQEAHTAYLEAKRIYHPTAPITENP